MMELNNDNYKYKIIRSNTGVEYVLYDKNEFYYYGYPIKDNKLTLVKTIIPILTPIKYRTVGVLSKEYLCCICGNPCMEHYFSFGKSFCSYKCLRAHMTSEDWNLLSKSHPDKYYKEDLKIIYYDTKDGNFEMDYMDRSGLIKMIYNLKEDVFDLNIKYQSVSKEYEILLYKYNELKNRVNGTKKY